MTSKAKYLAVLAAIGHAVLFSLCLAKATRLASSWLGSPITPEIGGTIFLCSSLVVGSTVGYFCWRSMRAIETAKPVEAADANRVAS